MNKRQIKNYNAFITKANIKFNSKYDYSKVKYVNNDTNVIIICPIHGEFNMTPMSHNQSKYGCRQCSIEQRTFNVHDFKAKANAAHDSKYDYSKVKYVNNDTNVIIICPIHGEFNMTPSVHINQKSNCPKCFHNIRANNRRQTQDEFITKSNNVHSNKYDYSKVKYVDVNTEVTIICPIHGEFNMKAGSHYINKNGCPKCNTTKAELEIYNIIPQVKTNDRSFIQPYELDILSHKHKLAIEFNGLLWHSFGKTFPSNWLNLNPKYHLNKTNLVEKKGYQLFHIFENEWLDPIKQNIWKSMINSKLGNTKRIYARKCTIIEISNDEYKNFIELNHIQGYSAAKIKLGLQYENTLVACMSFSKSRFTKNIEYELIRFCNIINVTVVGGAGKLLKYFERNYNPKSIVSYANRRWSQGNLYNALNFTLKNIASVNYYYCMPDKSLKLLHRTNFQKHMLKSKLDIFDESLTERENMINNNYRIIYDCGNLVYIKVYSC